MVYCYLEKDNIAYIKECLSMQLSGIKYPTLNLLFQNHSTAQYLDALSGSVE